MVALTQVLQDHSVCCGEETMRARGWEPGDLSGGSFYNSELRAGKWCPSVEMDVGLGQVQGQGSGEGPDDMEMWAGAQTE